MDQNNQVPSPPTPQIITPPSQTTPPPIQPAPISPLSPTTLSGSVGPTQPTDKKRSFLSKKIILLLAIIFIALSLTTYVLAFYLPNKPQNVYKTGLNRTGQTLNQLVYAATEKETLEKLSQTELTGSFEAVGGGYKFSGSISSKYDSEQTDTASNFQFNSPDSAEQKINIKFLRDQPEGNEFPDLFVKVSGLTTIELASTFFPDILAYDSKWISIPADYLKSLTPSKDEAKKENFTYDDAAQITRIVSDTTREYVLSADVQKSILVQKSFVGTEQVGNITANHYTVGLSKENTKQYCKVFIERLLAADAYKRIPGVDSANIEQDKEDSIKGCQQSADGINENDTFDMWINKKQKLIYKVRFSDKNDKNTYLEVGQQYTKGDQLPLFLIFHSDNQDFLGPYHGELKINLDVKGGVSTGSFTWEGGQDENKFTAKAQLEIKPTDNDVKIEKPSETIPISELLDKLGFSYPDVNNFSPFGGLQINDGYGGAYDTERQTDIKALHAHLEAYYAQNGFYPTNANLDDDKWVVANLKGLDLEVLKDPEGSSNDVVGAAAANVYSYVEMPSGCNNTTTDCTAYTLTATLEDGSTYAKVSLN